MRRACMRSFYSGSSVSDQREPMISANKALRFVTPEAMDVLRAKYTLGCPLCGDHSSIEKQTTIGISQREIQIVKDGHNAPATLACVIAGKLQQRMLVTQILRRGGFVEQKEWW